MSNPPSPEAPAVAPAVPVTVDLVPLNRARNQLAWIWFCGSGAFLLLLIFQTLGTVYQGHAQDLWSWALPTFMPTLGLIASVFAASPIIHAGASLSDVWVRGTTFALSRGVSVFYLVVLVGGTAAIPVIASSRDNFRALEGLALANYWLTPLQSLVVVFTGALFFTKEQSAPKDS